MTAGWLEAQEEVPGLSTVVASGDAEALPAEVAEANHGSVLMESGSSRGKASRDGQRPAAEHLEASKAAL